MTERSPVDQAARDRALDPGASFIVQAPAGSGKTELLIQRCLALLATLTEPESLLAITFTRKAAAEMRERILGALREVQAPGDAPGPEPRTRALARAALAADARHGWGLLANPSRLRIQTIDALNLGLARRLPVLSGLGAGLGVEEHADDLYRQAATRLLIHLSEGEPAHAGAIAAVLAHLDNRVQGFLHLVVEILQGREAWMPLLPGGLASAEPAVDMRKRLEAAREILVRAHLESLRRAFPEDRLQEAATIARRAAQILQAQGVESPIVIWAGTVGGPSSEPTSAPLWAGLAELLLTSEGLPRKVFNRNQGFAAGPGARAAKQQAEALCDVLRADEELTRLLHAARRLPAPVYEVAEWSVLQALLTVLRLAVAELEFVFAEHGVADYPRFAAAARAALGEADAPTDTALALDARLRHVLVDEFQDTSDAQVRLLEALTAGWQPGDGRTLFLVGDPMQSIYRFRDAEVGLFLNVRDRGLGDVRLERLALGVNFRSTVPIVEWLNRAFSQLLPMRDDVQRGAVAYLPVASRPGASQDGGVRVHPLPSGSRLREAREIADVAAACLAEPASGTVAILVQGRSHLVHIVAELARRGLAFRATDIDPLAERPIVLDLLALARALAHPGDRTAWLTVLRAPWCGLTLADLHALVADAPARAVIDLLRDAARRDAVGASARARLEQVWQLLEQALAELRQVGLRDTVERLWQALGGPATAETSRSLEEAAAFLDVLAQAEARDGPALDLASLSDALERLFAPAQPDPDVRIELLTIHKAKGLQFDTVIVPGLERLPRGEDKRLLRWSTQIASNHAGLVVAPLAESGGRPNALYEWLKQQEREKLLQERRRLLYVAATRARRSLHLFGSTAVDDGGSAPGLKSPKSQSMLGMLWPVVELEFYARLADSGPPRGDAEAEPARDAPLRRLPAGWRPPAPAPAPRIAVRPAPTSPSVPAVAFDWASQTARHVGTVVHRELQRLVASSPLPAFDGSGSRQRLQAELAELGVPSELRPAAIERVLEAVQAMLSDERGRWLLDAAHTQSVTELALSGRDAAELLHVVIDRSFVSEGVRWLVDYKTSPHEGGGLEEFLDREQQRYHEHLQRYAQLARRLGPEPVRVALYFPLQRAWREWLPDPD
jgi:ATP-dependent helicase/nuclease subunit A